MVAPERPVRSQGGFVELGLPLSRIFGANPAGRNAGWSLYGTYGEDQARARDIDRAGGTRHASDMLVGTVNYRMNRWVSFSYEQSLYTTHANPELPLPLYPRGTVAGMERRAGRGRAGVLLLGQGQTRPRRRAMSSSG